MTTAIVLASLLAAAAAVVFAPLLSRRLDLPSEGEKDLDDGMRLQLELDGLEAARKEGKIGDEALAEERDSLLKEAEESRPASPISPAHQAVRYPVAAVAGCFLLAFLAVSVALIVETQDLSPDIEDMVAGLESRVAEGDYTREDLRMLIRSYDVLGRGEDAPNLLRELLEADPDREEAALALAELLRLVPGAQEEAAGLYEGVLQRNPESLEALQWLAVLRVVEGRGEEASLLLQRLEPLVVDDEEAMEAMRMLRRMIEERMRGDG